MEYNDGSYGRDPYGLDGSEPQDGDRRSSGNPYGQSMSYGRDYYDRADNNAGQEGYNKNGYGAAPDPYGYGGNTGRVPVPQDRHGSDPSEGTGRIQRGDPYARSATGRTPMPGEYGAQASANDYAYGNTGRMQRGGDGYGYQQQNTGRVPYPGNDGYGYGYQNTGRIPSSQGYASPRGNYDQDTGRTQMDPRAAYGGQEASYGEDYQRPPRPARKKKKRSKIERFFRGLGAYIAQLPAKTLAIFGGVIAVVLVGIILAVILIPKGNDALPEDNGQLSITDITPTPSLAPTNTPAPVEEQPTEAPTPALSLNGVVIKTVGEENDVIPSVQERLVELGYMEMPTDGYTKKFGPATKTAVRLFQMKNYTDSKQWDGQLGDGTLSLLMSADAKAYYLSRGDGDERTASITKLVEDVKKLQDRLITLGYLAAGANTGVYGESTANAIKLFQQYHGLQADGKAGQATLTLIYTDQAMDAVTGKANDKSKQTPSPDAAGTTPATAQETPNAAATPSPQTAEATPAGA